MTEVARFAAAPLLERDGDVESLVAALDRACGGEGRLVLLEGEAGIGKTALLETASCLAAEADVGVLRARGVALERDFPHGVVRQLFERHVRGLPAGQRQRLLSGAAGLTSHLLGIEQVGSSTALAGSDAVLAANHGFYWLTAGLTAEAPLCLLVDDAHWADSASLRFLHYLARRLEELPVLVVVALRLGEPGASVELLEAIADLGGTRRLRPAPLSEQATGALLERLMGVSPGLAFVRASYRVTGGNPFLASELGRALVSEGLDPTDEQAALVSRLGPRSVARSVLGRLATLWPEALELARAVAVLDTDAELRQAAAIAGLSGAAAAAAADGLTAAEILAPGQPLRFAHPIIREAMYADMPEHRRAADHARAARILDEDGADRDRAAVHLLAAAPSGDVWAVDRLREAARRALRRGAPAAAVVLLRRALAEPPVPAERASLLLELGRACRHAEDPDTRRVLTEAWERASGSADRVAAARELAAAIWYTGEVAGAVAVLGAAAEAVAPDDRETRLALEAEALVMAIISDELAVATWRRIEPRVGALAGRTRAERLMLAAAAYYMRIEHLASGADTAELAERALGGGVLLEQDAVRSFYPMLVWGCLLDADRSDAVDQVIEGLAADARRSGSANTLVELSVMRARTEYARGNLADAEAAAELAQAVTGVSTVTAHEVGGAVLLLSLLDQGRIDDADDALGAHIDRDPSPSPGGVTLLLARAALRAAQGRADEAAADVTAATERRFFKLGAFSLGTTAHPARTLLVAGAPERAAAIAEQMVATTERWGVPGPLGAALLVLSIVRSGAERLELQRRAVELLEVSPRRLDLANGLVELGSTLRRAGSRRDARPLLERGMELAHRCGARPLAERARQELLACGARPRRLVVSGVDSLTASERRVARLAAEGLTNREIAQALFVTRKTVETHLGHIYRKVDVSAREQLAQLLEAAS